MCLFIFFSLLSFSSAAPPVITVSIPPQAFFIHQIAGPHRFDVNVMIPNGQSPAIYSPKPSQMIKMNRSDAFFIIGHPHFIFEVKHIYPFLETKSIPVFSLYEQAAQVSYSLDPDDPHIWMSPILVTHILPFLSDFLDNFYPEDSLLFKEKTESLVKKIKTQQDSLAALFVKKGIKEFYVYHPSWGYFAQDFNLTQYAIESHGHDPGPEHLVNLVERIQHSENKKIIIQKGFSTKAAEVLAKETGARIVEADPLAYDWFESIQTMSTLLLEK